MVCSDSTSRDRSVVFRAKTTSAGILRGQTQALQRLLRQRSLNESVAALTGACWRARSESLARLAAIDQTPTRFVAAAQQLWRFSAIRAALLERICPQAAQ